MTVSSTSTSEPGRNHAATALWLILGVLAYRYASMAISGAVNARSLFPLFMALAMGSPVLAMALAASLAPLFPIPGYVAIRYWVIPVRPQNWRNAVALPLIVLPCMIVASVALGLVASPGLLAVSFLPTLLPSLLILLPGTLAGACLYGVEKAATRLLFGRSESSRLGGSLCLAHTVGFAAILFAGTLPSILSVQVLHVPITQTWGKWLILPILICGELTHLLLTWRAWQSRGALARATLVGAVQGLVLGFVALSLIGAAVRTPRNGPLHALAWPLSYLTGWPPSP